ncbi:uncharacterized protein LOC132612278 [Lycium barbarum]|uniref:uncharacterized protein LOC132612277 n=1 Tax=Lycium barbarum TaxID=112863 RepID=UPI00293E556C|nr:uncharacterized protein LOC132612277 [Lycium barbarum]XP_060182562.1 uncharacterized protein LOC132612278 [Lycium barbarum]
MKNYLKGLFAPLLTQAQSSSILAKSKIGINKDRLVKWGMNVDPACVLCVGNLETRDHLFLQCNFTKLIWQYILTWLGRNDTLGGTWVDHLKWVIKSAKGRTQHAQIYKILYAETVHVVWMERNQRVFENNTRAVDVIARQIAFI